MKRWLLALWMTLLAVQPAFAGKGDEVAGALLGPAVLAIVLYPLGLALHGLVLAYSPRRGMGLVNKLEQHRWKTLILGSLNTFFLVLVAITLKKAAPPLSALAVLLWFTLAAVGSHGIARGIGARVLGRAPASEAPGDLYEVAVGWFVLLFALALPGLGLLLGLYWSVRATGGVVLTLFSVPVEGLESEAPQGTPSSSS